MKTQIWIALLFSSTLSLAQQSVVKDLGTFRDWKAQKITAHNLWGKDACVAFTSAVNNASVLEVYSPKLAGGADQYTKPTVQVVTKGTPFFVRGVLYDGQSPTRFELTLASTQAATPTYGLLARLADRKKLIQFLKDANVAYVQLIDQKNRAVQTLQFSLMGATAANGSTVQGCGLSSL